MQIANKYQTHIITWEKLPDDFPLPDDPVENLQHPLQASALREILELAGFISANRLIASNFGICANVNGKIVVKAPDWVYIPSTIPPTKGSNRRSYTPQAEGDKPDVVMEFLSDTDQGEYSTKPTYPYGKWHFYEQILQVPIYVIFDPNDGIVEVYDLVDKRYRIREADNNGRYFIPSIGLYLGVWQGSKTDYTGNWLRWWDESGNLLPWGIEGVQQSLQKGLQQGKLGLVNRQLTRKLGAISPELETTINQLSAIALDELSEALLDFNSIADLDNWLGQQTPH